MKLETTRVQTVTLTDTDIRIALCQYANLPVGSQVKLTARTDGEVINASVSRTVALADNQDFSKVIDDAMSAMNDLSAEADVDFPAGREAGARVTLDEDGMRKIFANLIAQSKDISE